ncbi:hypothetical protein Emed_004299 [Eimeria media]
MPSFQGSGMSDFGEKAEVVREAEGAPLRAEEDVSPRVKVDWNAADNRKLDRRENEFHGAEAIVRDYVDLAHALLLHFEETLIAKQRLTQGSLQCAEILCRALHQIQDVNPRIAYLVDRISVAIALLHKRKLADEKAAERGLYFSEKDSSPLCRTRSLNAESMSAYQQHMFGQPQQHGGFGGTPKNALHETADHVKMLPAYVAVGTQRSRSVSPAVQEFARGKSVTPVAANAVSRESNDGAAHCSRGSPRQQPSDVSNDEVNESIAVPSRKDSNRGVCMETAPLVSPTEREVGEGEVFKQHSIRLQADRARRSCPPVKHSVSRASSVTLDPHKMTPGGIAAFIHGPEGPMKTHFVSSQAAALEKGTACLPPRVGGTRRLFGEHEGEQSVRPLVLSETLVLSDKSKNSSARENDSHGAAVREALWLIKCASDFIQSGEGPEYVEKQFFRYSRSKDAESAVNKLEIPEGMQPSQGKYVLLRYAIALVEAEYGDSLRASDPHLYLPDLLRMRDILLRKDEGKSVETRERRTAKTSEVDEVGAEAAKEAPSLPERSPEERMERHLPLTILNLPASSQRPSASSSAGSLPSQHVGRQPKTEMPRLPSRPELFRAAASTESLSLAQGRSTSFRANANDTSTTHPAPIKLPSITSNAVSASIKLPSSTLASQALRSSELMSRKSFESSGTAGSRSPSSEDAPAHSSPLSSPMQQSRTTSKLGESSPSQSVEIASRSSLLGGRSGSGLVEHSVSLRRAEEDGLMGTSLSLSAEKPSTGERQSSKMSLAEQMSSAAASQLPAPPVDGLKLSVSSLRRDSATGTFSSRVFEAPSSPTEPPAISLSTSVGLRNVSASRSPHTSLPDIPDFVLGSQGSQQSEA